MPVAKATSPAGFTHWRFKNLSSFTNPYNFLLSMKHKLSRLCLCFSKKGQKRFQVFWIQRVLFWRTDWNCCISCLLTCTLQNDNKVESNLKM